MTVLISMLHPHSLHLPMPPYPAASNISQSAQMRSLRATSASPTHGKPAATNAAALDTKFFAFSNMLIVDPSSLHVAILFQRHSHPACRHSLILLALQPVCSHPLSNVDPLLRLVRHFTSRLTQSAWTLHKLVVRSSTHHVEMRHSDKVTMTMTVRTLHSTFSFLLFLSCTNASRRIACQGQSMASHNCSNSLLFRK